MKRILSLFAAVAITLSLSACQPNDTGQDLELVDEIASETVLAEETTAQTELTQTSNLTFDDINIIEINGQQVSLPFKVEELGEGYSIDKEIWTGGSENILKYNDNFIACIDINADNAITSVKITDNEMNLYKVKIYSFNCQNSFDEIIEILGEPYDSSEFGNYQCNEYLLYKYSNGEIFITSLDYQNGFNYINISYIN